MEKNEYLKNIYDLYFKETTKYNEFDHIPLEMYEIYKKEKTIV